MKELPPADEASNASSLRVLTYNIRHGQGVDQSIDLDRTARVIREQRPDVVFLQDVDMGTRRSGGVAQVDRLRDLTEMRSSFFGRFIEFQGGQYGMCALSKYRFADSYTIDLPPGSNGDWVEQRVAIVLRIDFGRPWGEIMFVGIHFYGSDSEKFAQAERLQSRLSNENTPAILAGDFNARPNTEVMEFIRRSWVAPDKEGRGFTFSSTNLRKEIDYVLFRPENHFNVIEHRVIDDREASDHLPVLLVVSPA